MSKIFFKNINKQLTCFICGKDDEFDIYSNISVVKERPFEYEKIPLIMISCNCGNTIFLTNVTFEPIEEMGVQKIVIDKMEKWNY